ncbi:MAG: cell division protein SepF [Eubacteriales bacterium]|nr:cell division protein SepF [Eubacteriales bacterium]
MSFLNNIVDSFKGNNNEEDDQYYLDEDYYDEDEYDYEEEEPKQGFFSSFASKKKAQPVPAEEQTKSGIFGSRKVVPIQSASQAPNMEVNMKRPKVVNDSKAICDELREGKAVVINLEGVDAAVAQRIIDFTLGSIYSMEGYLEQISAYIFIASPHNIELSGDFKGDFTRSYIKAEQSGSMSGTYGFNG